MDFDGFFAACEEQADRRLQGWPLGVIPFAGIDELCVNYSTPSRPHGVVSRAAV